MKISFLHKKIVLLLLLLFSVGWQAMATESCGIVFNLHDSYGDGWNGNKLVVSDGNALNEELTINNGSSASFTLIIAEGSHVTLSWIEGDFSVECSFSVQFENGYPIYESGNLSDTLYEFDLNCDDANTPVTITVASENDEAGAVSGGGEFVCGETCTVTATPNEGYSFWCWVAEGRAVSTQANYTFTVAGPSDLTAVFRPVSNVNYIVFEDPNVEVICLAEWDTDGDGYLSYIEAAAVTDLGGAFDGNQDISSFNELQYFTGLTAIYYFGGCTNLTAITIPGSVTTIGEWAFWACASLTSVTIPNSVTTIGFNPFAGCTGLETITVETGNQVYDSRDNCNAIIKTNTNTLIAGCKNTIIPNSVTSIGESAFDSCIGLTSITIPNSVTSIGDYAFIRCESLTSIVIPNSVNSIGESAFEDCHSLTSITFPNSLTTIGNGAFASCESLTSLRIPSSVASIGTSAFGYCTNLTSITVLSLTPPTLGSDVFQDVDTSIPVYIPGGTIDAYSSADGWSEFTNFIESNTIVFADENVEAICMAPETGWDTDNDGYLSYTEASAVTDLGDAFYYNEDITSFDELQYFTGLTSVVFNNDGLEEGCFMGCSNLTSIVVPSSVTAIGDYAFSDCVSLTSISIPSSVTTIGESAFEFAGLTAVNIPNSVTSIGMNAFNYCESLVSVTLPDALTTIEDNVFGGCSNLTSINIPSSVTAIGDGAFSFCTGLTSLTVKPTTPPVLVGNSVFNEVNQNIPVYVPGGTASAYMAADGWDYFFNYIETGISFADDIVETICLDNWDFDGDGQLSFEEAAAVTDLGGAFQGNEDITSFNELQYFTGLTSIGDYAFSGTSLTSITIPNSVTSIGEESFSGCANLSSVVIPNSVTAIGVWAFGECTSLTSIEIPSSVTFIGEGAFAICTGLEQITVEEGNSVYDSRVNCNAIIETASNTLVAGCKNTFIPNTVAHIEASAFYGCSDLTSMVIPGSVQSIGNNAFSGCSSLASFIVFNANVEMGDNVFNGVTIPENTFVAASASPVEGGGVFGLTLGSGSTQVFIGTLDEQNYSIGFVPNGSDQLSSDCKIVLAAKQNEGWQFVGWQLNGELVSDEALLVFWAFGEFGFEALFDPCGVEPEPELLSGRFSVSDCSTIGFARSNTIMNMSDLSDQSFAMSLGLVLGVGIPGLHFEIGENQWDRMTYDASALNGNSEAYEELLLTGVDILPSFMLKNNLDCWHIPTWREWDYMLNQRETASGIRFVYGIVNDVSGLIILPDDWEASTYYALSNVNEIGDYDNNVIDSETWTTILEPAGAVFLPANGYIVQGTLIQESSDGQAVGAYPGLLFSPNGDFMMGQIEGFPMTGPMTLLLDMLTTIGYAESINYTSNYGGTSLRLAKAMDNSTAMVALATNDAELGNVSGAGEFACQQECTVTATANDGNVFMYWLEDGVAISFDPVYSFKLFGDRNLMAVFAPTDEVCQISIETTAPSNASFELEWFDMGLSLSFDDGTPSYHIPFGTTPESLDYLDIMLMMQSMQSSNTNISYTHTINVFRGSNASLDIWMSEDMINFMLASGGSTSELGLTFNVSYIDGETIVEGANVLPIEFLSCHESSYVVSAESNNPEYGRVNGEILYEEEIDYGSNCTLTATANEGCTFVNWTENGEEVSTEAVYSFNVYSNRNLVANFSLNNYEITASANPVVGGSITGAGNYDYGTQCTLIAIPNEGYVFNAWTENGETVSTDAAYGFLVTDNRTLVANFAGHNSVGKLNGVFTASENSHIQFSQGNLQYQASTNTWSFASNQWDIVGDNNANISEIYNGWIDLFGWGTSGYDHGANAYQPWSTSTDYSDYYAYGAYNYTLFYGSRQADWGYNAISNGGNAENIGWRTPMYNEWYYVFNTRSTTSGVRYAKAQVEGVNGVILLPDDWSTGYFSLSNTNSSEVGYSSNVITASDWENCLQAHGAVFLPAAGHRNGTSVGNVGSNGSYWSSQVFRQDLAALLIFSDGGLFNGNAALRYLGSSVRLVCTASFNVNAVPSSAEGGVVSGDGIYQEGVTCSLTAMASEGYAFSAWTENGETVSNDAVYSFTVTSDRNIVAVFLPIYVIAAEANNADYGSVTGDGTFMEGETCTLTASPNEGYSFVTWIEDGEPVSTDAIYSFSVTNDRNLVAVFLPTYIITVEANNADYGTVTGSGTYVLNETCTVTATPAEGYHFVNWMENGEEVSTENPYNFTVTSNHNLVVNFALNYYNITATVTPTEAGMVTGMGTYAHGTQCTLTATDNVGYTFNNWTLDGNVVSTEPTYSFTVTGGGAYVANFMLNNYTITATANPSEGGTVSGAGNYGHGTECTLTAEANAGYNFDNWTLNGAVVSTEPTYTFTVTGPAEYVANFSLKSYDITATVTPSGAGTVTGTGTFYHGSQCTLTAIANEGYAFSNWMENGEVVSNDATYAFTVTGEHSLVAAFLPTYVITVEANNAAYGTVTGGGTYEEGETCTVTASPAEGYVFSAWTEDGVTVSTDAIYGFTVESAHNLVAVFLPTYVITAEANNADYGTVTGGGTYVVNVTCTVTANPAEGYEFVNWTENGEVVSTEAEYAFTVTGDRSLVANFVLKNYDILATANPGEGGTVSGAGNYNHFETCTLVATANWGYTFINWTLDGNVVSTEPSYTFTVTSAGDYTANFQLNNYAINASANPGVGGSVSGAGNYDHGTECTLTATANVGYTFVNWTLDGVEVGTDPTYTFTVYEEATYVANFSLNLYEITAIANPVEGGTITGAGNYYHGDECILTAIPIENYTFLYWTENGNYLSSDAIYSFVATSDRSLVAIFAGNEQTMSLSPGWTWLSSYIEMEGIDGLGMLENGLDPNGVMIKSQRDGFVSYAGGMWIGTLDGISNEKMYLVNTNEASDVTFTGPVANMMNHPITLNPNWTWLGYPVPFAVDINDALANLNASEGDVVKTQSTFATYSTNDGWYGSLNQLTPGMGLMYQSHNSQPVTFNYGVGMSRALKANLTAEHNHWVPDIHAYPNNMSIMAVVELNGEELQDERYELAVFNGSECRGSARLVYVPSLRRYVAFLTVTGEDDVELYLALYDTRKGKAYYNTTDCLNFEANAVLGGLSMPFVARFGSATELDELDVPNIELYPNPVVAGHLFQMEMPAECQGARVSIVNALGAVISTIDVYDEPAIMRAPAVPGVYTVRIVTDKQGTFTRKLIVNK